MIPEYQIYRAWIDDVDVLARAGMDPDKLTAYLRDDLEAIGWDPIGEPMVQLLAIANEYAWAVYHGVH